jgi:hypothetical protein
MIGIFLVRVAIRLEKERVFDTFGKEMYAMSEGFGSVFLCVVVGSMPCTMYTNSMVLSSVMKKSFLGPAEVIIIGIYFIILQ